MAVWLSKIAGRDSIPPNFLQIFERMHKMEWKSKPIRY